MDKDFLGLYKSNLQGFRMKGNVQAIALCHNHDDTNPSLSINIDGTRFLFIGVWWIGAMVQSLTTLQFFVIITKFC